MRLMLERAMRNAAAFKERAIVFPLACLATLAMIFISEGSYWQSERTLQQLSESAAVRSAIQRLDRAVLAAQGAQRSYLLTQRREYLEPYVSELDLIEADFATLDKHFDDPSRAAELTTRLQAQVRAKLAEMALSIELHDRGRTADSLALSMSHTGQERMDAIRSLSGELLELETGHVRQARTDIRRTLTLSRIGIAALSLVSLLALVIYLRQSRTLALQQQQLKRTAQVARDRLEIEVAHRTAELTELALHLQTAREDERARLARDLHDELGALLTSAKLDAARIKSRLAGTAPEALERLSHLVSTLNEGIALKRRIIEDLRPSSLDNLGLVETLRILAREFAERSGVVVVTDLHPVGLTPAAELVMYRVVQEAINNISKYANARHVWIGLDQRDDMVRVSVRDDGTGFDPASLSSSAHGLLGMRFRVEAEKGSMVLASQPGAGTSIEVRLLAA